MKKNNNQTDIHLSPTDLSSFHGCHHLTQLEKKAANKEIDRPHFNDPKMEAMHERGLEHEKAYLEKLKADGLTNVASLKVDEKDKAQRLIQQNTSVEATKQAMKDGVDVIFQARFAEGRWSGVADFLVKVEGTESNLGNYYYEVYDTKLAQDTKVGTVLQLCMYAELMKHIQGKHPEYMYVVKPGLEDDFETEGYRFLEFEAYFNLIKDRLIDAVDSTEDETYPLPVDHCNSCRWWTRCDKRWHDDDHLSLVANIRAVQISELESQGVKTLEEWANCEQPLSKKPKKGRKESYEATHEQAKIQVKARKESTPDNPVYLRELREAVSGKGFERLPEPNDGDVFFDIEGDQFYQKGGIEYLFGRTFLDGENLDYAGLWALDRKSEKKAFEETVDFLMKQLDTYPEMHVYHFGHYEPTAMKRLAMRHGTREEEIDDLLRNKCFVDLYSVTREGVRASVESYSIKKLEPFYKFDRQIDLSEVRNPKRTVEAMLECNTIEKITNEEKSVVEGYNKDDCDSTLKLHKWLEELRPESTPRLNHKEEQEGGEETELTEKQQKKKTEAIEKAKEVAELKEELIKDCPEEPSRRTSEQHACWILANLLGYFRREERVAWWEFFHIKDMVIEDCFDEPKAIVGLSFINSDFPRNKDGSPRKNGLPIKTYEFSEGQEMTGKVGDDVHCFGEELGKDKFGKIDSLEGNLVGIKTTRKSKELDFSELILNNKPRNGVLETQILDLAKWVVKNGVDKDADEYRAVRDILLRRNPRTINEPTSTLLKETESVKDGALRIAKDLNCGILPIQGPPGTGKTYTGADMIVALVNDGKRVGVTAVGHKVINNLLNKAVDRGVELNQKICAKHYDSQERNESTELVEVTKKKKDAIYALEEGKVVGGTAWLWVSDDAKDKLDYLFVDEAGQMSLAQVLACGACAKNIVFLGDPQQLEQPQKADHPEGVGVAALVHLLGDKKTIKEDAGLFLNETRRLHPSICKFTSDLFYDERLEAKDNLKNQNIIDNDNFEGSGLYYLPVKHSDNQNGSPEEVDVVKATIDKLTTTNTKWVDQDNKERPLVLGDILVVSPYNVQVDALKKKLGNEVKVGTVDKFQGQEAPVVIYSMASSSGEDAPRGLSFLYDLHRLNVATSRARGVVVLVASPKLLEACCRTVEDMRLLNAMCSYVNRATHLKEHSTNTELAEA